MSSQPQTQYRRLGKSGLRVSVPVIGAMSFGHPAWSCSLISWVLPEEKALPVLKAAWDAGLNTIDTANTYSNAESEKIVGKFLKTQGGLSRTALFNQVDASLDRLGTAYMDVLIIHRGDPNTPVEETMKALHDLVQSGKGPLPQRLEYPSLGVCRDEQRRRKNHWTTFSCIQVEHSLLYRPEEIEMFAYCDLKGIGILAYSPLMDGHLAHPAGTKTQRVETFAGTIYDKRRRDCDVEIRVQQTADQRSWTMAQVALAWSITRVSNPVVGISSVERVAQSINPATHHPLRAEDVELSDEELLMTPTVVHGFSLSDK
ncbi:Aldo/keto reductase [Hymenopellis radicata]|nr:Aldo/keto reductase [Hymenopellis radicata]